MRDNMWYLSFWVRLIFIDKIISSSIHFTANCIISLFRMTAYNSFVSVYHICLICSPVDGIQADSIVWLFWIMLQKTWVCMYLSVCVCVCISLCVCMYLCVCACISMCVHVSLCECADLDSFSYIPRCTDESYGVLVLGFRESLYWLP
jgi:hypothetical protein